MWLTSLLDGWRDRLDDMLITKVTTTDLKSYKLIMYCKRNILHNYIDMIQVLLNVY